jgi:uncharacterized protein YjdB
MGLSMLVGLLAGCAPKPASVVVSPDGAVVNSKSEAPELEVKVLDEKGVAIPDAVLTFSSSDKGILEVGADGALTIKGSGKAVVTATAGEVSGTTTVIVELFDSLAIAEESAAFKQGETHKLEAQIKNEKGDKVYGELEWASSDEGIATVDKGGVVTGVAVGAAEITASVKELKAAAKVEVKPAGPASLKASVETLELKVGATEKLAITGLDAEGAPVDGLVINYSSSDAEVAAVDVTGTVTAVDPGTAIITAECVGQTTTVAVTVKK